MSNALVNLSNEMAALVKNAAPHIVRIEARRRLPASGIVWSADGLIITAHHVVETDKTIRVGLDDGSVHEATLVGRDPSTDLALLQIDAPLNAPTWANLDEINVGQLALALARPHDSVLATLGVVSAVETGYSTRRGSTLESFLQTDVVMYPGFSGGALVAADGSFLGLNTSALLRGVSISLTTPVLSRVAEALSTHGHIKRGYLGVGVQSVALPPSVAQARNQRHGLLVVSVEEGSPAEFSGLMLGDTLLTVNGYVVKEVEGLLTLLASQQAGTDVTIELLRANTIVEMLVTLGERDEAAQSTPNWERRRHGRGGHRS